MSAGTFFRKTFFRRTISRRTFSLGLASALLLLCDACSNSPGRPAAESEVTAPDQIVEFDVLYQQNCAGCHGPGGQGGAAISLSDPVFLAIADDAAIRRTATNGVPGTPMPAFAQSAGGLLTEKQIEVLVRGVRSWAKPVDFHGAALPSYTAQAAGDAQRGADVYRTACSSCHGVDGRGGKASSIVDGSYLALASDQDLRMTVILGRPSLGAPDWRGDLPGRPLAEQEISDVVAWLAAQRAANPGQPYPASTMNRAADRATNGATGGIQ
jgi:mono/diheme cytochrome c family protein